MTSLFKWIVVHVLKSKLSYGRPWQTFFLCRKGFFIFQRDSIVRSIVAPELNDTGWRFKWVEKGHNAVYLWWKNILELISWWHTCLDSFVLVTSAFWHRQNLFSWRWWETIKISQRIQVNVLREVRHRSTEKETNPVFLIASVNPAILTVTLPICCRTKTNRVKNNLFLRWYVLHLNEWCQACPIWWQVFIYCFTDNILHRVTLEVKSPDRTLFGLVGDRGGGRWTYFYQAHIVNNWAIFKSKWRTIE